MSEWSVYLDIACQPIPSEDAVCGIADRLESYGFAPAIGSDKNGNVTAQLYVVEYNLIRAIDLASLVFWDYAKEVGVTDIEINEIHAKPWKTFAKIVDKVKQEGEEDAKD